MYPNLSIQRYSERERTVPTSNWKLYTIYEDQAITLDKRLLSLFNDAVSLELCHNPDWVDNDITDCDVRVSCDKCSHVSFL